MTDFDIDAEIEALELRKAKLLRLVRLREEVGALEKGSIAGTDAKLVLKIITEEVCAKFRIDFQLVFSSTREQEICAPRHVIFYLARNLKGIPLSQIGRVFHRDHGSVLNGCRRVKDRVSTEPAFAAAVSEVSELCKRKIAESLND